MSPKRIALVGCLVASGLLALQPAFSAPGGRHFSGGAPVARGGAAPLHGGHRSTPPRLPRPGWNGGHRFDGHYRHFPHYSSSHWGWSLGLGIGIPLALGWYDPLWGPAYYPSYTYGPVYRSYGYGYACEQDEDCWRERLAQREPAPPTTEVAPAAAGEDGGPTERPLHLNYCDSAKAWFPHVRTCPGGWRLVRPEYDTAR